MPPLTEEEVAADSALDSKLNAAFTAEMAATAPVADTPAEETAETETETAVETPKVEATETETPAPTAETTADDPEVAALLAKYGGDPTKALKGAVEAQKLLGRQGSELGELRREFEERIAAVQAEAQQQRAATQAPGAVEQLLDVGNYQAAAEYARQASNGPLYQHVMQQWTADPDQSFAALNYHTSLVQQAQQADFDRKLEERFAGISQVTDPLVAHQSQTAFERDFAVFSVGKDDIQAVAPAMLQVAQEREAVVSALLANEDPAVRQEAFDYLYTIARGRVGDTLTQAAKQADTAAQEAARAAKTAATVGTTTAVSQGAPKTGVDKFKADFRKVLFDDPTSIQKGLTKD